MYRVRNWADYEAGLQPRGSLTVWCTPQAVQDWYYQGPPQRGAQYTFSEVTIQTAWTLRLLYHLPLRQTEGFVASVLALMGLDLRVPDHTTLSRRQAGLAVDRPPQRRDQPMHLIVDSTGMIGDTLRARTRTNQQTEARLGCALLNRLLALAKSESYPLAKKA